MLYKLSFALLVLHTVDGRVIYVNPASIATLVEPLDAGQKQYEGRCAVHFLDGKSRGVAESCDFIREKLEKLP